MYTRFQNIFVNNKFLTFFKKTFIDSFALTSVGLGIFTGISIVLFSNPIYIILGLFALFLLVGTVLSVQFGLLAMVFVLYTRLSDIIVHFHNGPSVAQGFIAVLMLAIVVRWAVFHEKPTGWVKPSILLAIYGLIGFVSILYAENINQVIQGVLYFVRDAIITIIVVVLLQDIKDFRRVVWVLIYVGIFLGTLSTYQFLTGSFTSNFGGFANARIMQILGENANYRIGGPMGDPNYFAQIMIAIVPMALERLSHESNRFKRVLALWSLTVVVLSIVFTYSRSGFLVLSITLFLYYIIYPPRLYEVPVLIIAVIALIGFAPEQYIDRVFSIKQIFSSSNLLRVEDAALRMRANENFAAWEMVRANPLFGVGFQNYSSVYAKYARELGVTTPGGSAAAHNLYLEVLAESGLIGFVAFSLFIYSAVTALYQAFHVFSSAQMREFSGYIAGFGLGLVGYLIAAFFIHGAYPRYFYLLVGIGISTERIVSNFVDFLKKETEKSNNL